MSGFLPSLPMHELQSGEVIRVLLRRAQDLVAGHSRTARSLQELTFSPCGRNWSGSTLQFLPPPPPEDDYC